MLQAALLALVLAGCSSGGSPDRLVSAPGGAGDREATPGAGTATDGPGPERVTALGLVQLRPDGTTRLCDPSVPSRLILYTPGTEPPCPGVATPGLRLGAGEPILGLQTAMGFVKVTGSLAGDVLTVEKQAPSQRPAGLRGKGPTIPCAPPPGGWPDGGGPYDDRGPDDAASIRFSEDHPEWSGLFLLFRPAPDRIVAGGMAHDEAEATALRADLEGYFPGRVCVTVVPGMATLAAAQDELGAIQVSGSSGIVNGGPSYGEGLTQTLDVRSLRVTPELARFRDAYPPGLIELHPFLKPVPAG